MRGTAAGVVLAVAVSALLLPSAPPPALDDLTPVHVAPLANPPRSIDELRTRIAAVLERDHLPGAAIALVGRDGPLWTGGIGVADISTGAAMRADTMFRVGSLTKGFIGLGIMRLVEQGRLDVDRPLREILPEARIDNPWEDVAPVTIAQLLEHTSGLDDMRFREWFTDDDAMTPEAALALDPHPREVRWRPGTRFSYSNLGYTLAGRAIEVVTGEPFDAWMRREVLVPLGLLDADFRRTDAIASRLATGYYAVGRASRYRMLAHRPAGALFASAEDLGRLVEYMLRRGEGMAPIVSRASLDRIERRGTLPYPRLDTDYGLGNWGDVGFPVRSRGHGGAMPGMFSSMRYFPELGLGYVVLVNASYAQDASSEIQELVFGYLTRDRMLPPPPRGSAAPPGAGFFAYANPSDAKFGFVARALTGWRASERAGGVRLVPLVGRSEELVATPDGAYRRCDESGSSVQFTTNRDGEPIMLDGQSYAEAGSWWLARMRVNALGAAALLLRLAPLWALATCALAMLRRRRLVAIDLVLWPALAGLCWRAMPWMLFNAVDRGEIGTASPWTRALCATTIAFAAVAVAALSSAIRWSTRADRPPLVTRLVPSAAALGGFGLAVWLGMHGIIGLRTWAW